MALTTGRSRRRLPTDITGPVWNITMLLPITTERRKDLSLALASLDERRPFATAPSVHLARLVVLDGVPARRRPPPTTVPLEPSRLLFGVSVDGGLGVLVDELLPQADAALGAVLGCCSGFPGTSDRSQLLAWLEAHRVPAAIAFATVAAPAATVRRALERRDRLAALVARGPSDDPGQLRRAFARVVQP